MMVDNDHEIAASMPFYDDCVDHSTLIPIYHFLSALIWENKVDRITKYD